MRAGPLSNKKLIDKLNADFVNTWIIIPEFEKPKKFFKDPTALKWAKVIADNFSYPVDSIVLSSEGKAVAQEEFQNLYAGASSVHYLRMLDKVKKK